MKILIDKKAIYNTQVVAIEKELSDHNKHITTPQFIKLAKENFAERSKEENLASKNDTAGFIEI